MLIWVISAVVYGSCPGLLPEVLLTGFPEEMEISALADALEETYGCPGPRRNVSLSAARVGSLVAVRIEAGQLENKFTEPADTFPERTLQWLEQRRPRSPSPIPVEPEVSTPPREKPPTPRKTPVAPRVERAPSWPLITPGWLPVSLAGGGALAAGFGTYRHLQARSSFQQGAKWARVRAAGEDDQSYSGIQNKLYTAEQRQIQAYVAFGLGATLVVSGVVAWYLGF